METLGQTITLLKCFFLWPIHSIFSQILRFTVLSIATVMAVAVLANIIYQISFKSDDNGITILLDAVVGLADYFGFAFMYICFYLQQKRIEMVIAQVKQFHTYCHKDVIIGAEEKVRTYTKWILIYFTIGVCVNGIAPLFDRTSCNKRKPTEFDRQRIPCGLAARSLFPFDANTKITFPLVFIMQFITCLVIALGVLVITMCLVGLLIHIIAQLQHLRELILNVFNATDSFEDGEKHLQHCIKYHIMIIEYANQVNSAFNTMMLMYISLTSFAVGVLGYLIIQTTNANDKLRSIMHLGGWLTLLYLTCYYGQQLINESESVANAVYNSAWYMAEVRLQRKLRFVIMRAQKPLILDASSIGVMSLSTFLNVIRSAYSYFALLITITQ